MFKIEAPSRAAQPRRDARRPESPERAPARPSYALDMATFNTWGKPGILGTDEKERMEAIGPRLKPFSIAALQETFTRHAKKLPSLSGKPHAHLERNGDLFNINSGLSLLSNYPIKETAFYAFEQAEGFDRFAKKGVSFTRLEVPGIGEVDIYNTHYQAHPEHAEIRKHDNEVLAAAIRRNDKGNPTFVMGDFNMRPTSEEYQDLMERLNLRDTYAEANPGEAGNTLEPANTRRDDRYSAKRIDYIFALPNRNWAIKPVSVETVMKEKVGGEHLSDHYGLHGRYTLRRRGPADGKPAR